MKDTKVRAPVTPVQADGSELSSNKPKRTRLRTKSGARDILNIVGTDPDYVYRFVADRPGRIHLKMDEGWEIVDRKDMEARGFRGVGDSRVNQGHEVSSQVTVRSGEEVLVLMRQPREFHEEDKAEVHSYLDEIESQLTREHDDKHLADDRLFGKAKVSR